MRGARLAICSFKSADVHGKCSPIIPSIAQSPCIVSSNHTNYCPKIAIPFSKLHHVLPKTRAALHVSISPHCRATAGTQAHRPGKPMPYPHFGGRRLSQRKTKYHPILSRPPTRTAPCTARRHSSKPPNLVIPAGNARLSSMQNLACYLFGYFSRALSASGTALFCQGLPTERAGG